MAETSRGSVRAYEPVVNAAQEFFVNESVEGLLGQHEPWHFAITGLSG